MPVTAQAKQLGAIPGRTLGYPLMRGGWFVTQLCVVSTPPPSSSLLAGPGGGGVARAKAVRVSGFSRPTKEGRWLPSLVYRSGAGDVSLHRQVNELCGGCRLAKPSPGGKAQGWQGLGTKPPALCYPWAGCTDHRGWGRIPCRLQAKADLAPAAHPGQLSSPFTGPFLQANRSDQQPEPTCSARGSESSTCRVPARGHLLCGPG